VQNVPANLPGAIGSGLLDEASKAQPFSSFTSFSVCLNKMDKLNYMT
jgi:hypothetical protein